MSERERAPRCRDTRGSSGGARVWAGQPDRPPRSPSVRLRARRPLKTLLLAGAIRSTQPMLSITTKSPYALRALAELGRSGEGPVPIGELARRREIPVQFLEQLFAVMRRAGVLRSQRGVKGGYSFARPPHEITVLEVVELLDGPLGRERHRHLRRRRHGRPRRPRGRDHRRRHRARGARGRRGDVLHLKAPTGRARFGSAKAESNRWGTALDRWDRGPDCYTTATHPARRGRRLAGRRRLEPVAAACASKR